MSDSDIVVEALKQKLGDVQRQKENAITERSSALGDVELWTREQGKFQEQETALINALDVMAPGWEESA